MSDLSGSQVGQVCQVTTFTSPLGSTAGMATTLLPGQINNPLGVTAGDTNAAGTEVKLLQSVCP